MAVVELEARVRSLEKQLSEFSEELRFALRYLTSDAASSLTKSRVVLEKLLTHVYQVEMLKEPRKPLLAEMLADNQFSRKVDRRILSRMNAIREMANLGAHGEFVKPSDAGRVLDDLCEILDWYMSRYGSALPLVPAGAGSAVFPVTPTGPRAAPPGRRGRQTIAVALLLSVTLGAIVAIAWGWWANRPGQAVPAEPDVVISPTVEVPDPDAPK